MLKRSLLCLLIRLLRCNLQNFALILHWLLLIIVAAKPCTHLVCRPVKYIKLCTQLILGHAGLCLHLRSIVQGRQALDEESVDHVLTCITDR